MFLGGGPQPGEHAPGIAQNTNCMGADGPVRLGIFVDLQQGDLVVAHEGQIAVQINRVGDARVAGHGGGAQAIDGSAASALAAPHVLDAHAGGEGLFLAAANRLDGAAACVVRPHQNAVAGHGPQTAVRDAQLVRAVVRSAHRRPVVQKRRNAGDHAQLLRQGVLALLGEGDASAGGQRVQIPLERGVVHAGELGKLVDRPRHVGALNDFVE